MSHETLETFVQALNAGEPVALATVVEVEGAAPAPTGSRMAVWRDGRTVGTVGGGALEQRVLADARAALEEGRSRLAHYVLREEGPDAVGMLCGGEVRVFVEVHRPQPHLVLVGGGNIGQPLAEMARLVGFRVTVVDVDAARGTAESLDHVPIGDDTYVVIMTAEANADEDALGRVLDRPAAYLGMIGSRRKIAVIFEHLREAGASPEALARVRAPIGLDLGGRGPAEVALAVVAEIVAARYGGTGQPLSRRPA